MTSKRPSACPGASASFFSFLYFLFFYFILPVLFPLFRVLDDKEHRTLAVTLRILGRQ
jgi:hypothetical protein